MIEERMNKGGAAARVGDALTF